MTTTQTVTTTTTTTPTTTLPIIDLTSFLHPNTPDDKLTIARALDRACTDHGFFYITGHGVPAELCENVLEEARKWFMNASEEEKERVRRKSVKEGGDGARGYQRVGENVTGGEKDWHEAIDLYRPVPHPATPPYPSCRGPNNWPLTPPTYRPLLESYITALLHLGETLMRALSLALDPTTETLFQPFLTEPFWVFRIIGYPPLQSSTSSNGISCGAHTDYGCLTLLLADSTPDALQVLSKDGKSWLSADPHPGAFVVNIGDMLEIWSNGLWKSTVHRVIHRGGGFRVSVPFFYEPDWEAWVVPLEGAVRRSGGVARCRGVRYGEHLLGKVGGNFYEGGKGEEEEGERTEKMETVA